MTQQSIKRYKSLVIITQDIIIVQFKVVKKILFWYLYTQIQKKNIRNKTIIYI